jgi:hypothetical protein
MVKYRRPGGSAKVTQSVRFKTMLKQIVIIVSSCFLLACATSQDAAESGADDVVSSGHDCISQSTIRDYQVLDDSNLIVTAGAKRKYHVELSRRAFGLRSNWQIGFKSPTGRACAGTGEVIVDDGFGRRESIRLSSVRLISADELDELLVRYGKKVPEFEQAAAEEEVNGAEVEELD